MKRPAERLRLGAKPKLFITATTLRTLSTVEVRHAAGGMTVGTQCDSCTDPRTTCCPLTF